MNKREQKRAEYIRQLRELAVTGVTYVEAGDRIGLTGWSVARLVRDAEIVWLGVGRHPLPEASTLHHLRELAAAGISRAEIARRTRLSDRRVKSLAQRLGIEIRNTIAESRASAKAGQAKRTSPSRRYRTLHEQSPQERAANARHFGLLVALARPAHARGATRPIGWQREAFA